MRSKRWRIAAGRRCLPTPSYPTRAAGSPRASAKQAPVDPARARAAIEAATGQDLSNFASNDTMLTIARGFVDDQIQQRVPLKDCGYDRQHDGARRRAACRYDGRGRSCWRSRSPGRGRRRALRSAGRRTMGRIDDRPDSNARRRQPAADPPRCGAPRDRRESRGGAANRGLQRAARAGWSRRRSPRYRDAPRFSSQAS